MADRPTGGTGKLAVEMVTPTGPIAQARADAVIAPGELGEFEVLPGHIPFLTALHPGVLVVRERERKVYAVSSGFLEVSPAGEVRVLVERAVPAEKVDTAAARAELEAATRQLADWKRELDAAWRDVNARRAWAQAQLDARGRPAP